MTEIAREVGRTLRAALDGWGPTMRLLAIIVVLTACAVIYRAV